LRDLASAADSSTAVARSRITVSQFLTDWLETIKPRVRETTWVSYRIAVERITRHIGAAQLQSLTPLQVEGLYATLLERGGSGGRPLAPKTVRNCHIVLRRALADAERLGLVSRNPAASAKAVSAERPEPKKWSSEEIQRFFDAVVGERLSMAFVLLGPADVRGRVTIDDRLLGAVPVTRKSSTAAARSSNGPGHVLLTIWHTQVEPVGIERGTRVARQVAGNRPVSELPARIELDGDETAGGWGVERAGERGVDHDAALVDVKGHPAQHHTNVASR
jgi:hypothetical protein